ncbi:hypothetical protein C5167_011556 [Papaver somniferum]|uniref:C2 domain-containing protein n=1 Tax=Papaver somniferum TaxID=3469 RepID=A0A4Y7K7E1_PAPSO|nr:elicitor-responsive protein 1-like [Papaver somniferum]RZC67859.1 hypothetical protein C5167_011556 [Papaver somniferum]
MKLREGKTLVGKCGRVQPWNYYLQTRYSKKILELDNDLKRFFQMDVQADMWCDTKQMRCDIKQILLGKVPLFDHKLDLLKTEIGTSTSTMNVGAGATDGDQGVHDPVGPGIQLVNRLDQYVAFKKRRETTRGTLEVLLADASKLKDTDFFGKMDPYVIIQFGNQKRKSTVARGEGKAPVWNEKFTFDVEYPDNIRDEHHQYKLDFTIMDKDRFSRDDFVGESTICVTDVLSFGVKNGRSEIRASSVVLHNRTYSGEIRVSISFTRKDGKPDDKANYLEGWKQ